MISSADSLPFILSKAGGSWCASAEGGINPKSVQSGGQPRP